MDAPHQKITPHRMKTLRRLARETEAAYRTARSAFLDQRRAGIIAKEDALSAALEARFWWQEQAKRVRYWEPHVELGAAWSPNALKRHQQRYGKGNP